MSVNRQDLYSVHIANLPASVSEKALESLFKRAGDVKEVFKHPQSGGVRAKYTFAFVRYETIMEVKNAIRMLDKVQLDEGYISVSMSDHTKRLLHLSDDDTGRFRSSPTKKGSILHDPMPRGVGGKYRISAMDERQVHVKLKQSLYCIKNSKADCKWLGIESEDDSKLFMKDFKDVLVDMSKTPHAVGVDAVSFGERAIKKVVLRDIIIRYHEEPVQNKQLFKEIDIDLTDDKLLSKSLKNCLFGTGSS